MHEIKFRVYSKENEMMYEWEELLSMDSFKDHMEIGSSGDQNHSPMMQYTGLNDRNGEEIYEGDYLRVRLVHDEYEDFIVVWKQFSAGFALMDIHGTEWNFTESNEFEVIGNIHEHPHLLEQMPEAIESTASPSEAGAVSGGKTT